MSEAPEATKRVALVNVDRVVSVLEVLGFVCLAVAAFATDWRLGVAFIGVLMLAGSLLFGRAASTPQIGEDGL